MRIHVRWLIGRDYREVLAIDAAGYASPLDEVELKAMLRKASVVGMAAEADVEGGAVVGYFVYRHVLGGYELLRFAVRPDLRRRGVGRAMLLKMGGKLDQPHRNLLTALIPEGDEYRAAYEFLKASGFASAVARGAGLDGADLYRFTYTAPAYAAVVG